MSGAELLEKRIGKIPDELAELMQIARNLHDELHRGNPGPARLKEIRSTLDYLSGWLEEIDSTDGEPERESLGHPARGVAARREAAGLADRARKAVASGDFEEAVRLADRALDADRHFTEARLVPAEIDILLGSDTDAVRKLFHVTEVAREQLQARQAANPFLADKPFPLAFDFLADSDARAYARALELLAGALFRLGRYDEAHRFTEEITQLDPKGALFAVELRAAAAHMAGYLDEADRFYDALGNSLLGSIGRILLLRGRGDMTGASVGLQQLLLEYPTLGEMLLDGGEGEHWARSLGPERHREVQELAHWRPLWRGELDWIRSVIGSPNAVSDLMRLRELAAEYGKARTDTIRDNIRREFERLRNPIRLRTREVAGARIGNKP